ncbi:MAG TPA: EthD domain-containing protein [Mycobacterium sp.]|uniref:EthD domain-containing protein n=1 Tax=Rhodococcus erythropolis TaxID=1833 RepID=UPI0024B7DC92|nr:EthD domain-containing protein [Rhodococcus erythropolis]MDJ0015495.1 EthD domain-containing protein [Rhodococcus erythropolis]
MSSTPDKISVVVFLKRKPGTTKEEFAEYYNSVHAKMAEALFGHLYESYTRNLVRTSGALASAVPDGAAAEGDDLYDAITVITFANREALAEMQRLTQEPDQLKAFLDDEDKFLDRSSKIAFMCDQYVSAPVTR